MFIIYLVISTILSLVFLHYLWTTWEPGEYMGMGFYSKEREQPASLLLMFTNCIVAFLWPAAVVGFTLYAILYYFGQFLLAIQHKPTKLNIFDRNER